MGAEKLTFKSIDNRDVFELINTTRKGVDYDTFDRLTVSFPLSSNDWSRILNISERTIQRYRREKKRFDSIHTERLLLVMLLFKRGVEVFGDDIKFATWLNATNISLGGIKPISLLDNSFGINMIKDELYKIEHGTLA